MEPIVGIEPSPSTDAKKEYCTYPTTDVETLALNVAMFL